MLISIGQLLAYTLVQTFGVSIFTLSLYRLQKIAGVYRLRAFFYLLLVNTAGALTFGLTPWLQTSKPVAAGLFILGIPFMLLSHLWLFCRRR
jgi:hypothetical protein